MKYQKIRKIGYQEKKIKCLIPKKKKIHEIPNWLFLIFIQDNFVSPTYVIYHYKARIISDEMSYKWR